MGLKNKRQCRPILESFYINAPVAAQSFIPRQELAVRIVPIQINTVHPNRGKRHELSKEAIFDGYHEGDSGEATMPEFGEGEVTIVSKAEIK